MDAPEQSSRMEIVSGPDHLTENLGNICKQGDYNCMHGCHGNVHIGPTGLPQ